MRGGENREKRGISLVLHSSPGKKKGGGQGGKGNDVRDRLTIHVSANKKKPVMGIDRTVTSTARWASTWGKGRKKRKVARTNRHEQNCKPPSVQWEVRGGMYPRRSLLLVFGHMCRKGEPEGAKRM